MEINVKAGEVVIDGVAYVRKDGISGLDGNISRFKPESGERYWCVKTNGDVGYYDWDDNWHDVSQSFDVCAFKIGNIFKTKKEAEMRKLRLESMANRWRPEKYGTYYHYDFQDGLVRETTYCDGFDMLQFFIGNTHKTKEEAKDWGKKYAEAWEMFLK
jgi:hypothetical protein